MMRNFPQAPALPCHALPSLLMSAAGAPFLATAQISPWNKSVRPPSDTPPTPAGEDVGWATGGGKNLTLLRKAEGTERVTKTRMTVLNGPSFPDSLAGLGCFRVRWLPREGVVLAAGYKSSEVLLQFHQDMYPHAPETLVSRLWCLLTFSPSRLPFFSPA